jgi:hypothetical protein
VKKKRTPTAWEASGVWLAGQCERSPPPLQNVENVQA